MVKAVAGLKRTIRNCPCVGGQVPSMPLLDRVDMQGRVKNEAPKDYVDQ